MTQTLEQLSAAAMKARVLESRHIGRWQITLDFDQNKDAARHFAEAYRTGQLVAVRPDDATVERVARAMAPSVFEPFDPEKHGSPVNHEFAKAMWIRHAEKAIAEMKGPSHERECASSQ
jgi:hypothetical protein